MATPGARHLVGKEMAPPGARHLVGKEMAPPGARHRSPRKGGVRFGVYTEGMRSEVTEKTRKSKEREIKGLRFIKALLSANRVAKWVVRLVGGLAGMGLGTMLFPGVGTAAGAYMGFVGDISAVAFDGLVFLSSVKFTQVSGNKLSDYLAFKEWSMLVAQSASGLANPQNRSSSDLFQGPTVNDHDPDEIPVLITKLENILADIHGNKPI